MSQRLYGSLCLSDILEKAKAKDSAFSKAKNGKIYFNVVQWINDEEDQYGNISGIQLQKEKGDESKAFYIGNMKDGGSGSSEPVVEGDIPDESDLPF